MGAIGAGSAGVRVRGLQMATAAQFAAVKVGEDAKRKHYRALCWAARPLDAADVQVGSGDCHIANCSIYRTLAKYSQ